MTILSYRGPCSSGGVSSAISRAFERHVRQGATWWHLSEDRLIARDSNSFKQFCVLPPTIVEGHYRYCNNFLWPILHDLPDFASCSSVERLQYQQFNLAVAANVQFEQRNSKAHQYYIQDYQFALVPTTLSGHPAAEVSIFWHVPWPKAVRDEHLPMMSEIALGLLSSTRLGFHVAEYADNFLRFVQTNLPEYSIDMNKSVIEKCSEGRLVEAHQTNVIVQPLGLDLQHWKASTEQTLSVQDRHFLAEITSTPYVLSVDRADYTKGVIERIRAIDEFFAMYPEWRQKITFVQVCQRSRQGLNAFDDYWRKCTDLTNEVNSHWRDARWTPIVWVSHAVSPMVLAKLYRGARAMLVNPLRDGLNLTAKEWVACTRDARGVLMLSDGAGVWHEFGRQSVLISTASAGDMASAIYSGLLIPVAERQRRLEELKKSLYANDLAVWSQKFAGAPASNQHVETRQPIRRRLPRLELVAVGR